MENYLDLFKRELRNRNYAYNTIKHYSYKLKLFLAFAQKDHTSDPAERISLFLDSFKTLPVKEVLPGMLLGCFIKLFYIRNVRII